LKLLFSDEHLLLFAFLNVAMISIIIVIIIIVIILMKILRTNNYDSNIDEKKLDHLVRLE